MQPAASRDIVMADAELPSVLRERLMRHVTLVDWDFRPEQMLRGVRGIFTFGHPQVDEMMLERLPDVCVISNLGVGVDYLDVGAATGRRIPVGYTPRILGGVVADLAFAPLLYWAC